MNNRPASTIQQLSNPFTYGKPVSDTKRFVGRKEEVQQIFSLLRASDFGSGSIVGERRSGKTSFLNYISHPDTVRQHGLDPDACLLVYLDLDMLVPTSTPSRFYEYMLRRIAARVQDQKLREQMREVGQQEKIVNYDLDELFDSVDAQGLRIALLLDEFQNVANNGNFGLDFLYGLRSLATHHGLALITSNRVSLEETGPSETMHSSPWFNIFSTTILLPFSRSDVEDMLQKYLQGTGVSFTDTEVRYVLSLAGMMPFSLQAAFGFLFEAHQVERDEDHMLAFVKERFEQVASPYFESCWHNSSEREKAALALLTLLASQHNGQPSYWKSAQLESWYMNAGGALNRLADRGLLIRGHDRYALASTSLYRWIAEELTSPAREADREEERRYESQIKASLPQQDVARIVQWLRGVDTKYRSLFARWACDPRTSEKAFDLFTSSKLPFEASGMRRGDVESGSTEMRASEAELQIEADAEQRTDLPGTEWEQPQLLQAEDGLLSILFTDLEGSTELLNRLGNEANQELLHVHNDIVRERVSQYGGTEVKSMGDGFMVVFASPRAAADCAVVIQRRLEQHNLEHQDRQLKVRMGINAGEVIQEDKDFFGNAVVLAARVMAQASGGQIFVSELFQKLLGSAGSFHLTDRGWKRLRGFDLRQHIYEITWRTTST